MKIKSCFIFFIFKMFNISRSCFSHLSATHVSAILCKNLTNLLSIGRATSCLQELKVLLVFYKMAEKQSIEQIILHNFWKKIKDKYVFSHAHSHIGSHIMYMYMLYHTYECCIIFIIIEFEAIINLI